MLLFDNLGHGGMSKVIEFDPFTQQILWSYESTPRQPFSSLLSGSNQRLPNGNTLITESDTGRAFEVTRDGRIVWEYRNPARAGDGNRLVAILSEVVRLDSDFGKDWIRRDPEPESSPD
jgi:predicted Rdx family selenoprotein